MAGYADPEKQRYNTPDAAFGIGSITKTFIAVLLLQLHEEGRLPLDAPVSRWLDDKLMAGLANAQSVPPDNCYRTMRVCQAGRMNQPRLPTR